MSGTGPLLGDVLRLSDDPFLKDLGVGVLDEQPIASVGDISGALYDLVRAALGDRPRIHPDAYVSPLANVAEDVVIGPGTSVHEFSTVRGRTVLSSNVHVGYGCEISRSVVGEHSILSHRATVGCCVIGRHCYFSAELLTPSCLISNTDMLRPDRPISFALPGGGRMSTGEAKWSAVIGDHVRAGSRVSIGPGAIVGARSLLEANATVATAWIPPDARVHGPAHTITPLGGN
ncbi:transferase [Streptomyces sp. NPDC001817]|uniref:transferase n=1 Tax=Streptomyces sp. NPDC001817 TaxID=3154398 RepID=UPI0033281A63